VEAGLEPGAINEMVHGDIHIQPRLSTPGIHTGTKLQPGEALLRCKLLNLCPTEGELRIGLVKPSALKPTVTEAKERLLSQDQFGVLFEHVYASGGSIFEDSLYEGVP